MGKTRESANLVSDINLFSDITNDRVGVGINNPSHKLDVNGTIRGERYRGINSLVLNTYATINPASNVFLYSPPNDRDAWIYLDSADTGSNWGIYHRQIDSTVSNLPANSIGFIGGGSNTLQSYISLATGNAYFAGNLGIGVVSPATKVDVSGSITASGQLISTQANSTTTGGGQIYLNGTGGNRIDFNTNGVAAPAFTTRSAGTKVVLYPQVSATEVDYALGINGSTLWYSVPGVTYTHRWYGGTTNMMSLSNSNLTVTGSITCVDVTTTSDISLKTDLQRISDSLSKVSQLNGYEFNWKSTNKPSMGVVAQELEKVFPQLVTESDPKSVNYNGIIAVLIESIKELNQKVEDLTEEVSRLRMSE